MPDAKIPALLDVLLALVGSILF